MTIRQATLRRRQTVMNAGDGLQTEFIAHFSFPDACLSARDGEKARLVSNHI